MKYLFNIINKLSLMPALVLVATLSPALAIENSVEMQKKLKNIHSDISQLNRDSNINEQSKKELETRLKQLNKQISISAQTSLTLQHKMRDIEKNKIQIDVQNKQLSRLNEQETRRLNIHARIAWRQYFSRSTSLLRSSSISQQTQLNIWSQYYRNSRLETLDGLTENRQSTQRLVSQKQLAINQLSQLKKQHDQENHTLRSLKKENQSQAKILRTIIASNKNKISRLKTDQANLEKVLKRLEKSARDLAFQAEGDSFSSFRGKLPWPVSGKKRNPELKKGVYISAAKKQSVKSIASGRIIYAATLKGFGKLVILDHGEGYMSLYGQNDLISVSVGDWVDSGQPIASIKPARGKVKELYFEIRKNGSALPVRKWCAK